MRTAVTPIELLMAFDMKLAVRNIIFRCLLRALAAPKSQHAYIVLRIPLLGASGVALDLRRATQSYLIRSAPACQSPDKPDAEAALPRI